jgi:nucleoside-diphosphate-sugar epimerase
LKNIIIFGASGFLGTQLKKNLLGNIVPISLREKDWLSNLSNVADVFINCIGKAHDHKGTATEHDFYFANYELVKVLFDEFLKSNAQVFIHISSIAAVEENERNEVLTENSVGHPQSHYGKSKKAAEEYLIKQNLPYGKKLFILRPTMIHGEGDKGNLGLLYKLISKGIPYPLASFDNKRSFISIDNFSYFINQIIENKELLENGIYHISDDEAVSTKEIIEIIKKVKNNNTLNLSLPKVLVKFLAKIGDIIPLPLNTKRLKKMTGDLEVSNQKIKNALGITQLPISAKKGIEITIKSFK